MANPETVKRLIAVFDQVALLIKSQPDQALQALQKAYPQVDIDTLKLAFTEDSGNWSSPAFSVEDVRQEAMLLGKTVDLPGLKTMDFNTVVYRLQ